MDEENVVYLHDGVLHSRNKNNDNLNLAEKWIELENMIMSEVAHTQKDNYDMNSLISVF